MITEHDKQELAGLFKSLRNSIDSTISNFESNDDKLALSPSACHFVHDLAGTLEAKIRSFEEALKN